MTSMTELNAYAPLSAQAAALGEDRDLRLALDELQQLPPSRAEARAPQEVAMRAHQESSDETHDIGDERA